MNLSKSTTNQVFDINKLPAQPGILFFLVSMSRISKGQSAQKMWEYWRIFSPDKIIKPMVGIQIAYTDYLYFNNGEPANELKKKYLNTTLAHKHEYLKILARNPMWIDKAWSFTTWGQLLLETKDFTNYFGRLKKLYERDATFKKYILEDIAQYTKEKPSESHINFVLEETLMYYLVVKGKVILRNDFVEGHEKWILWCYPGRPLMSMLYIQQKNPFYLFNPDNIYEHSIYDLDARKLYDAKKLDLETLTFD